MRNKGVSVGPGSLHKQDRTPECKGPVPWYVGFIEKELCPECQRREWDEPHPFLWRLAPCAPPVPANALPHVVLRRALPSRAAYSIRACSRSGPNTSASSASTATRGAPSSCSPTSMAASWFPPP